MEKRSKIIEYFLENPNQPLDKIGKEFNVRKSYVSSILTKAFNIEKPLWFCLSLSMPNTGFLFDQHTERTVLLKHNEIINKSDFTEQELLWMLYNCGIGFHIETKIDFLKTAKKEIKQNLIHLKANKKVLAYLESL